MQSYNQNPQSILPLAEKVKRETLAKILGKLLCIFRKKRHNTP